MPFWRLCNDIIYRACRFLVAFARRGTRRSWPQDLGAIAVQLPLPAVVGGGMDPPSLDTPLGRCRTLGSWRRPVGERYRSSSVTATPPRSLTWSSGDEQCAAAWRQWGMCPVPLHPGDRTHTRGLRLLARELRTDLLDHRSDGRQLGPSSSSTAWNASWQEGHPP
jgi:hypothetical protein